MNMKNAITLAVAALTVLTASAAMADKIGSVSTATPDSVVFTSSGSGGTTDSLNVTYADGVWSPNAGHGVGATPVTFNLSATGGSSTSLGGSDLKETFTSGTFSITNGATDILSGSFTGGVLTTLNPSLWAFRRRPTTLPALRWGRMVRWGQVRWSSSLIPARALIPPAVT